MALPPNLKGFGSPLGVPAGLAHVIYSSVFGWPRPERLKIVNDFKCKLGNELLHNFAETNSSGIKYLPVARLCRVMMHICAISKM